MLIHISSCLYAQVPQDGFSCIFNYPLKVNTALVQDTLYCYGHIHFVLDTMALSQDTIMALESSLLWLDIRNAKRGQGESIYSYNRNYDTCKVLLYDSLVSLTKTSAYKFVKYCFRNNYYEKKYFEIPKKLSSPIVVYIIPEEEQE